MSAKRQVSKQHTCLLKVGVFNLVTCLDWTPINEWFVIMRGSKNIYRKDTHLKEIGLSIDNPINLNLC
jgi:hypothetical protein